MFERLSKAAIQVILIAQQEARGLGHDRCGTEQILLGLIRQDQGIAAILKSGGLTLDEARSTIKILVGQGNDFQQQPWFLSFFSSFKQMPFTERSKKVLEVAWDEARLQATSRVDADHLFLALLRLNEGIGVEVLKKHGFNFDQLRLALVRKAA